MTLQDKALETALNIDSLKNILEISGDILQEFRYDKIPEHLLDHLIGLIRSAQNTANVTTAMANELVVDLVSEKDNNLVFDYTELVKLINKKFGSLSVFAKEMGISEHLLNLKLGNRTPLGS